MPIIIYLLLLVIVLSLIVLFSAIGLTFKFNVLSLEKRKEYGGTFTIKWLLFSHTFSFKEPKAKEFLCEEPKKSKTEEVTTETGYRQDNKGFEQSEYRAEDFSKTLEEKTEIKEREAAKEGTEAFERAETKGKDEKKEKRSPIEKTRGKKGVNREEKTKPGMGMATREKLYWGLEAFRCLRKPLLCLFSDMLHGIKIKRLDSCMTFGLSDPADTGMLCGLIHAVAGFIYSRCRYCSFSINPVFMMNYMLDFRGDAEIRVKIYSMIFPFIKFVFNRNTLSFTYSLAKELFHRKWESEWEPKWKSRWKSKWKSNS